MPTKVKPASRCATGTEGLDDILGGGLPKNRIYLIQGDPGVGKTTLAMQFLLEGARLGESGLYITLSETKEELESVAESHGWKLNRIHLFELSAMEEKLQGETETTFFHPSEVELNRTTRALLDEVERVKPSRVVFDSLSELRMLAETPLRYRRQILQLKQFFAGRACTVLLLDDRSAGARDLQIESIAHGVVGLQRSSPDYGISRRQINVQKIRGVKYREGNHDLVIRRGGLVIFPRLVAAEHHINFKREIFSSGNKELDALLGGGLDRGTGNMFMGPPGTGKSTLAVKFAIAAAKRRERVLFYIFDETKGNLVARSKALDMDIEPYIKNGMIQVEQVDPAEISPGELAYKISQSVIKDGARMIIVDSINGYLNAMPGERYLNLQLHELLGFLNQQGVITIMVLAQQGLMGNMQSAVDLTYLADTVVLLRYFEARGVLKQALSIVKKRTGNHERTIREISIGKGGVQVSEPLTGMQGVLTGVPSFLGGKDEKGVERPK
ncbi:MAG: circadian clock protein KaiC [Verrucomicrobia bacterium]|jgi:circadian clock protein KaiC|nr:circadian clock protein KaiC [Verrucomicrobiota bacterium]